MTREYLSFHRYHLPAYDRNLLCQLLSAILLVGRDLDWWAFVLQRYAGFPQLVPDDLLDGVLGYIILTNPMYDTWKNFLAPVSMSVLHVSPGSALINGVLY